MPHIAYFADNIFAELGLVELPLEKKIDLLEQMNNLVHKRVMVRMLELLPAEAKIHLPQIEQKPPEEQMEFLLQYVPDLAGIVMDEVDAVKKQLQNQPAQRA